MASRIRNDEWKEDLNLENELKEYVQRNYRRQEILTSVKKKYPQYAWSLRTLSSRLQHFNIRYIDYGIQIASVYDAVSKECNGPGSKLGYRSMTQKVREVHGLKVPRDIVYEVMKDICPDGLEERGGVGQSKRRKRNKRFVSPGSNYTMSLDGHDKLCGYQKFTFPLHVYGGQDTFSGKIMFLKIWTSNNSPEVISRHFFEHIVESKVIPQMLRVDRGTETDLMTAIHCRLLQLAGNLDDDTDLTDKILYGPSTANKIERWWRELNHRLEKFFKSQLSWLLDNGHYDQTNQQDRDMLAFIFIPVIQKELDIFRTTVWNHKRGRKQENKQLPTGIPDHIYENPEEYGGEDHGIRISEDDLLVIAEETGVLDKNDNFISEARMEEFKAVIPFEVEPKDAAEVFILLKEHFQLEA